MYLVSTYSIDYKNAKKSIKCYVIIWITIAVVISIHSILVYIRFHRLIIVVGSYLVVLMVMSVYVNVLSLYSFLLYNARIRFNVLNKTLRYDTGCIEKLNWNMFFRRSFETNRKITEIEVTRGTTCDTLMKMAKLHGQLNDIIDDTNGCYSVQV